MEQAEIEHLKSENQRLKQQLNQDGKANNEQFANELVNKGILMPANKSQAVDITEPAAQYAENTPKDVIALDKKIRAYMHEKGVDYKTAFNEIHSTGEK